MSHFAWSALISSLLASVAVSSPASVLSYSCADLLAQISEKTGSREEVYVKLLKHLAQNTNSISVNDLKVMLSRPHSVNPFEVANPLLSPEQAYAFNVAFEKILKNQAPLDREMVNIEIGRLIVEKRSSEQNTEDAKRRTESFFAPIVTDNVIHQNGAGKWSIRSSFETSDGGWMFLVWDGDTKYLYDAERKNRILLGDKFNIPDALRHYTLASGKTLLGTFNSIYDLNFYEITSDHELKVFKEGVEAIEPAPNSGVRLNLHNTFLTESQSGRPAFLETFYKIKDAGGSEIVTGYLEVEIETGNQRLISPPNDKSITTLANGHVINYGLNEQGHLIVQDLTTNIALNDVIVPKVFNEEFDRFIPDFPINFPRPNSLLARNNLFKNPNQSPAVRWIDLKSGRFIDLTKQNDALNSAIVLTKQGNNFQVIRPNITFASTIWIYDYSNNNITSYGLPPNLEATTEHLLRLRNGKTFLFVGGEDTLVALKLDDADQPILLNLKREGIKRFINVHETMDGRINGLFETRSGFKIIQIYGPPSRSMP